VEVGHKENEPGIHNQNVASADIFRKRLLRLRYVFGNSFVITVFHEGTEVALGGLCIADGRGAHCEYALKVGEDVGIDIGAS
jgi:hypothetical protein